MSVIRFDTAEIVDVFSRYQAWRSGQSRGPAVDELGRALLAFHYANVSAYAMQYQARPRCEQHEGDRPLSFDPDLHDALQDAPLCWTMGDTEKRALVKALGSLLYNTCTNAGTDFMPVNYRETVEAAQRYILADLAHLDA